MNMTIPVCSAMLLAFAASGLVVQSQPVLAQQAAQVPEEVVVVEAPLEGREVGRTGIGAKITEYDLKRPVSYADLNLCKDADVAEMKTRIEDTAKGLCKELSDKFPLDPSNNFELSKCTSKAVEGANEQLKTAIADANSDSDGDGVANCMDQCPGTPSNAPVDNAGCTLPETSGPVELRGVHFAFDSSELTADSTSTLDGVVEILQGHPDLMVEIAGHTDDTGPTEYNQGLSERRAQAVRDYLVSQGVNADNITARGYGELEPVADNGTREGRAANRRVELKQK